MSKPMWGTTLGKNDEYKELHFGIMTSWTVHHWMPWDSWLDPNLDVRVQALACEREHEKA